MKLKLLILFCFTAWSVGFAQTHIGIDSLKLALKTASTDSARFTLHFKIYREYVEFNNDSALYNVEQQILIAKRNNMKIAQADGLETKGYVLQTLGRYAESFQTLNQALEIANNPANEARNWYPDSLRTPHKIRLGILGYIQLDLGHVMGSTDNIDKQIFHYKEAIRLAKEIENYELLGLVTMNLGTVYMLKFNELDSAIQMERTALTSFQKAGHKKWIDYVLVTLGDIYIRKKEYKLAVEYFHKAIQASKEVNNLFNVFFSMLSLTDHYINEQNKDSSYYYALKMGDLIRLQSTALPNNATELYYPILSKSYKLNNQPDSAYKYLYLAFSLKDSSYQSQIKNLTEVQNLSFEEKIKTERLEKEKEALQNQVKQYTLLSGLGLMLLVALFLYRNNRQKQKNNNLLQQQKEEIDHKSQQLEKSLLELKSTQTQLIQSEKMASLGELTAGIAHEIQNPLNFVNNFSELNKELVTELNDELATGNEQLAKDNKQEVLLKIKSALDVAKDLKENSEKINQHGQRASNIVKGMLEHSRKSTGVKEPTDINKLCDEFVRLSYHGLRAKDSKFNCDYKLDLDPNLPPVNVVSQDIGRVLLNIINNAFQACNDKSLNLNKRIEHTKSQSDADQALRSPELVSNSGARGNNANYSPLVIVNTKYISDKIEIIITDNGSGISDSIKDKIFQPFFTTKPTGQGTGLGLSLSYDIVKAHGGEIKVNTKENEGSEFIIQFPLN